MKTIETKFIEKNLKVGKIIKVYSGNLKDFHFDIVLSLKPFIIFCMSEKHIQKYLSSNMLYKIDDCSIIEYENNKTKI